MPTIRLATEEDYRAVTSKNVEDLLRLAHLYIPTDEGDMMRAWGVAGTPAHGGENSVHTTVRLYPGALVAPCFQGQLVSRGDLLYHGAEPAADFVPGA